MVCGECVAKRLLTYFNCEMKRSFKSRIKPISQKNHTLEIILCSKENHQMGFNKCFFGMLVNHVPKDK